MHDQNTQRANHAAITRNRFPRAYATGHACENMENMQDRSVAKVKAKINNIREYLAKISPKDH